MSSSSHFHHYQLSLYHIVLPFSAHHIAACFITSPSLIYNITIISTPHHHITHTTFIFLSYHITMFITSPPLVHHITIPSITHHYVIANHHLQHTTLPSSSSHHHHSDCCVWIYSSKGITTARPHHPYYDCVRYRSPPSFALPPEAAVGSG